MWEKSIFVIDANVMLNLYRYSQDTRNKLIAALKQFSPRLWVPHQAAWEYQRNRLDVISKQREAYNEIERAFAETPKKLESVLGAYNKHPLINIEALLGPIRAAFETQARELGKVRDSIPILSKRIRSERY